jgi:CHAT domain-containing protein/tetratricopeptide (TPR) repeat protein
VSPLALAAVLWTIDLQRPRPPAGEACRPGIAASAALQRGRTLYEHGWYKEALPCLQSALRTEPGSTAESAQAHRWLGRTLFKLGRLDEAVRELDGARRRFVDLGDPLDAARVDSHLGAVAAERNEPARARELYVAARQVFLEAGPEALEDLLLVDLNLLISGGDTDPAPAVEAGLARARELRNPVPWARYLRTQGSFAASARDFAKADELFDRAQEVFLAAESLDDLGRLFASRGFLRLAHGDPAGAATAAATALRLQDLGGDALGAAQSLNLLGTASTRLGRHRAAVRYFDRALRGARERHNPTLERRLGVRLAEAHLNLGAPRTAAALLERALVPPEDPAIAAGANELLARALVTQGRAREAVAPAERAVELARNDPVRRLIALHTRAMVCHRLGRAPDTLADLQAAMELIDQTRQIPSDALRQQFRERHQAVFGLAVDVFHRLGRHEEALQAAEKGRARAFLDLLADRAAEPSAPPPPPGAPEIAELAARMRSHVLAYWVGPEATLAWVVGPEGVRGAARVPVPAARLASLVYATTTGADAWRQGRAPERSEWRELHRLLVEPVARWLPRARGSRVTVVPHGPLFRLSFAGLRDAGGVYLVERHALHHVPALGVFRFSASDAVPGGSPPRYLLVADPSGAPPAPGNARRPALPGARREVAAIRRLLGDGAEVTSLVGAAAGEAAVTAALGGHGVAHLAVHGDVRDEAPLSSFLALGSGPGASPDGRLTAAEVYTLKLQADLVFLSACRSGRGPVTGDGILGLTRAFLSAGASSLVTTLWDVPDMAAAELVPTFYRSLLRASDRSAALRAAQLSLLRALRDGRLKAGPSGTALPEDPALWAAYVLVGHPGPDAGGPAR